MRSIFLERILNSIVGSIDNLLSGLGDRVDDVSQDLEEMNRQLDTVKEKIDQAITVYGTNLQSMVIVADDNPGNSLLVNDSEIQLEKWSDYAETFAKYEVFAGGQFFTYALYSEGKSNNLSKKIAQIEYQITRNGVTQDWTLLHTLTTVDVNTEPDQNKITPNQTIDIQVGDIIEFRYYTADRYSTNILAATIKEFRINYSIHSLTSNGGGFVPRQI